MRTDDLERARAAISKIPVGARADWDGTNHYEITSYQDDNADPFWLTVPWMGEFDSETEDGKRLGAVLDAACWARELLDEVDALRARIARLEKRNQESLDLLGRAVASKFTVTESSFPNIID